MNTAVQYGMPAGMSAVAGATAADYLFITLAISGVGKLMERKSARRVFSIAGPAVLALFGVVMISRVFSPAYHHMLSSGGLVRSFSSTFFLTLSSPLSIVFWTGIFTSKTLEYSMKKKELIVFGSAAGFATFFFIGCCVAVLSPVRSSIPSPVISAMNIAVGAALILYAVKRFSGEITRGEMR
jgi:threonine/homoserine/homoserine lactone efflux protein